MPHSNTEDRDLSHLPKRAQEIITTLHMQNIPHEGPWFLQTYKSEELLEGKLVEQYPSPRYAYTAIYGLITKDDFSAMHRLLTDEMWHFYEGSPLELLLLYPDGHGDTVTLGGDFASGQHYQFLVPRGVWMGARTTGTGEDAYSLGCNTLTPGFEFDDYEPGFRNELIAQYPDFTDKIIALTRDDSIERPS